MKKTIAAITAALALPGCATPPEGGPSPLGALVLGVGQFLIDTDPNRTETVVFVGGERHVVTTHVSANGRKATARVSP